MRTSPGWIPFPLYIVKSRCSGTGTFASTFTCTYVLYIEYVILCVVCCVHGMVCGDLVDSVLKCKIILRGVLQGHVM